jgi:hypothetical protein
MCGATFTRTTQGQIADAQCGKTTLFNHPIGGGEQCGWHHNAEALAVFKLMKSSTLVTC